VLTDPNNLGQGAQGIKVRVMIRGAPVTRAYADEIGAEGFTEDCASAVDEAARLMALIEKAGFR